jgi:hypothetical protein
MFGYHPKGGKPDAGKPPVKQEKPKPVNEVFNTKSLCGKLLKITSVCVKKQDQKVKLSKAMTIIHRYLLDKKHEVLNSSKPGAQSGVEISDSALKELNFNIVLREEPSKDDLCQVLKTLEGVITREERYAPFLRDVNTKMGPEDGLALGKVVNCIFRDFVRNEQNQGLFDALSGGEGVQGAFFETRSPDEASIFSEAKKARLHARKAAKRKAPENPGPSGGGEVESLEATGRRESEHTEAHDHMEVDTGKIDSHEPGVAAAPKAAVKKRKNRRSRNNSLN